MHVYPATSSMQEPWFRHGLDAHSLMLVWQLGPGERAGGRRARHPRASEGAPPQAPPHPCGAGRAQRQPRPGEGPGPAWAPLTAEALAAGAHVAAGHVPAGAPVGAGVGLALVVVDVTVGPAPPGVTVTLVPAEATTVPSTCARAPDPASVPRTDGTEGPTHSHPGVLSHRDAGTHLPQDTGTRLVTPRRGRRLTQPPCGLEHRAWGPRPCQQPIHVAQHSAQRSARNQASFGSAPSPSHCPPHM